MIQNMQNAHDLLLILGWDLCSNQDNGTDNIFSTAIIVFSLLIQSHIDIATNFTDSIVINFSTEILSASHQNKVLSNSWLSQTQVLRVDNIKIITTNKYN